MSVLAHVVQGGPQQNEPAATQALTYILRKNPSLVRSLISLVNVEELQFEPGRVESEKSIQEGQPDVTIYDQEGRLRVFVENKFWAGLTQAQPVSYLQTLSNDFATALIFVVPYQRVPTVFDELKERCEASKLVWVGTQNESGEIRRASVDDKNLLVMSWNCVLIQLLDAVHSEGMDEVRADILQLRGLTDSMNLGAFLPLQDDEPNNQELPNRLLNYIGLISPIVNELCHLGLADVKGLTWASSAHSTGRYLKICAPRKFSSWLGYHLEWWRDEGISPIWCEIYDGGLEAKLNANHYQEMPELFRVIKIKPGSMRFPVRLKTGVEREKVIAHCVSQIEQIATNVLSNIPE